MGFSVIFPLKDHKRDISARMYYSSGKFHGAVDYRCPENTIVCAAQSGTITTAKYLGEKVSYGRYIKIDHGTINGKHYETLYAHINGFIKTSGYVEQGTPIAYSGSVGNSTGPHLHFEVRVNGTRVWPEDYLVSGGTYGNIEPDSDNKTYTPQNITVTYSKWSGYGTIKKDYTKLLWYQNNTTTPTDFGFYGMYNERIDYIGKIGSTYYYGWVKGICEARILCVVPCNMVKNITGKASGGKGTIAVGVNYTNNPSTGSMNSGDVIDIPAGCGTFATREFSTEGYKNCKWKKKTAQRRVWQVWKDKGCPTTKGFAAIDGKILIACTSTFGKVGDNVTWEFSNGDTLDTIIGDFKSQQYTSYEHNPANKWGHNNGKCVLEFCGVPKGIKGYNNPYLYFGWTKVSRAANHGHYV